MNYPQKIHKFGELNNQYTIMKRIVGLDLGPNSIGWSVLNTIIHENGSEQPCRVEAAGSRIIPMDAEMLGDFAKGNKVSQTADKTKSRSMRIRLERALLRRERLHRVLDLLGFLPEHYSRNLDRYGKFNDGVECRLAWTKDSTGKDVFLYRHAFEEMLADFSVRQPQLVEGGKKVPYDWTIYYLRKKALTQKVEKEELAWILLHFNQKRGYFQLRDEMEVSETKREEYLSLRVVRVEDSGDRKGSDVWYNVYLENGMIYRRSSRIPLDWEGKVKDFIVTTDLDKDGNPKKDKDGNVKRSFRAPKEDDWTLLKKKTEADLDHSGLTVGAYIYDALLDNPDQKIRGKLVRTIERKYYKEELRRILECQMCYQEELRDRSLYQACVEALYPHNDARRSALSSQDFVHLFLHDILFYQRPLKSKKSLISDCPYEERAYVDKETGEIKPVPLKCIAKSHPLYQEFRLWQFVSNLRIYQREKQVGDKLVVDANVTNEFLRSEADYAELFRWLNEKKEVKQDAFLKYPGFRLKPKEIAGYRWNYVEDKPYPCNETHAAMLACLKKADIGKEFLTDEREELLWHILYSIDGKQEMERALRTFARKNGVGDPFVDAFKNMPAFKKEYGAYSLKAVKKLLSVMRKGMFWKEEDINPSVMERIDKIVGGEYDNTVREKAKAQGFNLAGRKDFSGLPVWLACYVVYGRHSEAKEIVKWNGPEDIDSYLKAFKQHSLRNPIVEQVLMETLRTVRDIWKRYGTIDEIHVEMGRDIKNNAERRAEMSKQIMENENTNMRIKCNSQDLGSVR